MSSVKAPQAHFIIKAAQRKQELLYEAQALGAAIAQAERELAGLHQASEQMRKSNAEVACSFRWGQLTISTFFLLLCM